VAFIQSALIVLSVSDLVVVSIQTVVAVHRSRAKQQRSYTANDGCLWASIAGSSLLLPVFLSHSAFCLDFY